MTRCGGERGSALVLALLLALLASLALALAAASVIRSSQRVALREKRLVAREAAEAGFAIAARRLALGRPADVEREEYGAAEHEVTVLSLGSSELGDLYELRAEGRCRGVVESERMIVAVQRDSLGHGPARLRRLGWTDAPLRADR